METLLITDACLLGLSLIQAVLGIIIFKPRPAVISFLSSASFFLLRPSLPLSSSRGKASSQGGCWRVFLHSSLSLASESGKND